MMSIRKERLLLVEGRDDERFFTKLCSHEGLSNIQIIPYDGKPKLGVFLKTLIELPRFDDVLRLGVTRDADENAEAARQSVWALLRRAGLPRTDHPATEGVGPGVAVMVLPPERAEGCLETLLWETIETTSSVDCIRDLVACAAIPEGNRRAKAKVHAYIATKKKPGLRIGEAADAGYWDLNHGALDSLKKFLSELAA